MVATIKTKLITCPSCDGNQGEYLDVDLFRPCGECDGMGEIEVECDDDDPEGK